MTRQECEEKINEKLVEIREIVDQYDPAIDIVNIGVHLDNAWAFTLRTDEKGKAITGDYLLNSSVSLKREGKTA